MLDVAAVGEALEALRERFGASTLLGVATCAPPEGLAEAARWAASGLLDAASVTLHSAVQPVRDEMMPGASIWPLPQVRDALCVARLPRLEIAAALEEGVNAGEGHLRALADFCKELECTAVLSAMLSPQGHPLAFPRTLRLAEGMLRAAGVSACVRPFRPCHVVTGCPKA